MTDRCGFVALVGRPNVGKSTLLNALLGEKLAITSPRPQTTRNRIPGILTRPDAQIIFIDTPGIHNAKGALHRYMNNVAREAFAQSDVIMLLTEADVNAEGRVSIPELDRQIVAELGQVGRPVLLVLNKIDRIEKPLVLPLIDAWRTLMDFREIVPISALKNDGVTYLVDTLLRHLPESTKLYGEDELTELPARFLAAELVRERLFHELDQELPYATAVTIESWRQRGDGLTYIDAVIHVERDSQKGIVIGKGGTMLKRIGTEARKGIESMLGCPVHLKLFVRVEARWTDTDVALRKLGYE
jgi:GTP-binding protein Era